MKKPTRRESVKALRLVIHSREAVKLDAESDSSRKEPERRESVGKEMLIENRIRRKETKHR